MQQGFYFDQTVCTRCCTCIVACKDWHDVPAGPASYLRIKTVEKGVYPEVSVHHMFLSCYHCAEPVCVAACPAEAITKRSTDGIVVVDRDACLGKDSCGGACLDLCPYDAPQFGAEPDAKMQKCDFCIDRLEENKNPICVDACPFYALDAGPVEELRTRHGGAREVEGFNPDKVDPSLVVKPRIDTRGLKVQKIVTAPRPTQ